MSEAILILDTATEACSVTLTQPEGDIVRHEIAPRRHAELLLPMIDEVLKEGNCSLADLSALAFVRGPGAFTGVRIAASAVQGLALAHGKPVIGISSLQLMAQEACQRFQSKRVAAAIDARMGEVYWCCYQPDEQHIMQSVKEESVCSPESVDNVFDEAGPVTSVGTGWLTWPDALGQFFSERLAKEEAVTWPDTRHASAIVWSKFRDGDFLPLSECTPVYLRNTVAKKPKTL